MPLLLKIGQQLRYGRLKKQPSLRVFHPESRANLLDCPSNLKSCNLLVKIISTVPQSSKSVNSFTCYNYSKFSYSASIRNNLVYVCMYVTYLLTIVRNFRSLLSIKINRRQSQKLFFMNNLPDYAETFFDISYRN